MTTIIIAIITSSAFATLISNLFTYFAANRRQNRVNQILLLGELERRIGNARVKGSISDEQLKIVTDIVELYHAEGGDGYADGLIAEACTMPRV